MSSHQDKQRYSRRRRKNLGLAVPLSIIYHHRPPTPPGPQRQRQSQQRAPLVGVCKLISSRSCRHSLAQSSSSSPAAQQQHQHQHQHQHCVCQTIPSFPIFIGRTPSDADSACPFALPLLLLHPRPDHQITVPWRFERNVGGWALLFSTRPVSTAPLPITTIHLQY